MAYTQRYIYSIGFNLYFQSLHSYLLMLVRYVHVYSIKMSFFLRKLKNVNFTGGQKFKFLMTFVCRVVVAKFVVALHIWQETVLINLAKLLMRPLVDLKFVRTLIYYSITLLFATSSFVFTFRKKDISKRFLLFATFCMLSFFINV